MKYDVFGIGNPLIDVIINTEDQMLEHLSLVKGSMNLVDSNRQREILDIHKDQRRFTTLGGSCANTMVMISQLGGQSAYCGKVGLDEFSDDYEDQLINTGVSSFIKKEEGPTGSTIILVTPDADRTMNTNLGNSQNLSENDLDTDEFQHADYLYVTGYLWDTPVQKGAVLAALKHAKSIKLPISLSLSDLFCVEKHKSDFQNIVKEYVDLLFCNEQEAAMMTDENDPEKQIEVLSKSVSHVALTCGAKGSLIYRDGKVTKIDAFPVDAIDTTGAGDSFAAGYLYGLAKDYSTEEAGKLASKCASVVVSHQGPRFNGDFRAEVSECLK